MSDHLGTQLMLQSGFLKASGTFESPDVRILSCQHDMPRLQIAEGGVVMELEFTDASCLVRFAAQVQRATKAVAEADARE